MIAIDGGVEHRITDCAEQSGNQTNGSEDSPDQQGVRCAEQHPRYACGGEPVRVARYLRRGRKRRQQQQRSGWMKQQEVAVGEQAVYKPGSSGVVHTIVIVPKAEESSAAYDRN